MSNTLITGPAVEPVTLDELKTHCRVSIDDDNDYLTSLGLAARAYTEMYCRRQWIYQTWQTNLDHWPLYNLPLNQSWRYGYNIYNRATAAQEQAGIINVPMQQELLLPKGPVSSIISIQYYDTTGTLQTMASTAYQLDTSSRWGRLVPAYGSFWPSTRVVPNAVQIVYVTGFGADASAVPEVIKHAIKILVGHWYSLREPAVIGKTVADVPYSFKMLLAAERQPGVVM